MVLYFLFQYFSFTLFSMCLNELHDFMLQTLPPTDSRLRPDVRILEEGNIGRVITTDQFRVIAELVLWRVVRGVGNLLNYHLWVVGYAEYLANS